MNKCESFCFYKNRNKNDEICSNSYLSYFGASCVSILTAERLFWLLVTNQNNAFSFFFFLPKMGHAVLHRIAESINDNQINVIVFFVSKLLVTVLR